LFLCLFLVVIPVINTLRLALVNRAN
jgi:hypothetical protein